MDQTPFLPRVCIMQHLVLAILHYLSSSDETENFFSLSRLRFLTTSEDFAIVR